MLMINAYYYRGDYSCIKQTPLHIAIEKSNIDIVKYLVEQGHADVNIEDKNG